MISRIFNLIAGFVQEGDMSLIGFYNQITEDRQEAIKSTIDAKNNIEAIKKNIERLRKNNVV